MNLQELKEVGQEANDVLSDGRVHVSKVFDAQVAHIEGQGIAAEPLDQLDVVQGVSHGGRVSEGNLTPRQIIGAVQGDEGGQTNAIRQLRVLLDARKAQLGRVLKGRQKCRT